MKNKIFNRILCVIIAAGLSVSLFGCKKESNEAAVIVEEAEEDEKEDEFLPNEDTVRPSSKEETVNIKAKADGSIRKIKISETITADDEEKPIEDISTLSDIINPDGDEEFTTDKDDRIIWENKGQPITYEGNTEKKPPVGINISYYLNGQKKKPEEMAGANGNFKIVFRYKNKSKVPFIALSMVALPSDVFSHVKVKGGKTVISGGNSFAVGYAAVGLGKRIGFSKCELTGDIKLNEKVVITGKCKDFELDYTETMFTNGIFSDIKKKDINDLLKVADKSKKLKEGSAELAIYSDDLYEGVLEINDYLKEYVNGVLGAAKGMNELSSGMKELNDNAGDLKNGANSLKKGLGAMNKALESVDTEALAQMASVNPELASLVSMLEGLKESTDALYTGSVSLSKGVSDYTKGVSRIYNGSKSLSEGVGKLSKAGDELKNGSEKLLSGTDDYRDAIKEFDEKGIKKLSDLVGEDYRKVVNNIKKMRKIDKKYTSFTGDGSGKKNSVSFIFETDEIKKQSISD
ncbi:MAG: hypothetical protein K6F00_00380 [Lachnospiraceae bacterium]|nr:hypothetical protein [Lachnospiraceae bacterium]